jgi:hypothetical protein
VTGSGNVQSSGGTTPNITTVASPTFTSETLLGPLTPGYNGTAGSANLYSGTGVPSFTAPQGSVYLSSTGQIYVNYSGGIGGGGVAAVTGSGNIASSGGTAPNITISNAPTFSTSVNAPLFESLNGHGILGLFNVKDYGATGNGSTDDSAAIQSAANAATAANGTLYFPAGAFYMGATVTIATFGTLNIMGQGMSTQLYCYATGPLFSFANSIVNLLTVKDFYIGVKRNSTTATDAMFYFPGGQGNSSFYNVYCVGSSGLEPATFYYCAPGASHNSVYFINCHVYGCNQYGYVVGAGSGVYWTDCRIIGAAGLTSTGVYLTGNMGGATFVNCDIIGHNIAIDCSQDSGTSNRQLFINQTFLDSSGIGLNVRDSACLITVIDCWASSCTNYNISYLPTSDSAILTITGGTIIDAGSSGSFGYPVGLSVNQYGIVTCSDVLFINNKAAGFAQNNGARVTPVVIQGCRFHNNGATGISLSSQVYSAGYTYLRDNVFDAAGGAAAQVYLGANNNATNWIEGNVGWKGYLYTFPTLPASTSAYTNNTGQVATIYFTGGTGTQVSLKPGGVGGTYATWQPATATTFNTSVRVNPHDNVYITYSSAPSVAWVWE